MISLVCARFKTPSRGYPTGYACGVPLLMSLLFQYSVHVFTSARLVTGIDMGIDAKVMTTHRRSNTSLRCLLNAARVLVSRELPRRVPSHRPHGDEHGVAPMVSCTRTCTCEGARVRRHNFCSVRTAELYHDATLEDVDVLIFAEFEDFG